MSQREICAYTLLPRQTVNNVINVFASQGLLRWGGSKHDKRVKRIHLTDEGGALPPRGGHARARGGTAGHGRARAR
ncbi:MarR family winged helix-turn-helix transcriptional regulator [Bifidobacterium pseudolongum]|uniref:MarR family winged helix-turn-helix transcriptional regulator n=1 Tax=Bifidobacterium pseudolongum TaxID=1694 RepID=UPI001F5C4935|nr:MarR family winged helix-turn-helix transcriptional regulator [Bifidobacterium pseudolongum]